MSDKKSFKIYKEWSEQFSALDNESAGELIKAILEYQITGEVPEGLSPIVSMAFSFMKQQFERDDDSYAKTSEARSEAGKKGGAPKGNSNASKTSKNNQKQAKTSKNKQNKLEEEVEVEEEVEEEIYIDTDVSFAQSDSANLPALSLNDGTSYELSTQEVENYKALYPAVDVEQQVRAMCGWLDANPKNRKTRSGIKRFINSWLSKEQNRAPRTRDGTAQDSGESLEEIIAKYGEREEIDG
jgi:hypothetical protein